MVGALSLPNPMNVSIRHKGGSSSGGFFGGFWILVSFDPGALDQHRNLGGVKGDFAVSDPLLVDVDSGDRL